MADKKVRIGFVGVGGMGQNAHLKNYKLVADCEVVAIAEIKKEMAAKVAKKYDIPAVYSDPEEMIKKEKLDGIVASQQFTRHGILIPGLLKHKIPVFTEKPIAGSIEVGERIVEAEKKSGTFHMVGYHKRSDPAVMYAKAEIEKLRASNELGKLKYVRILMPSGDWVAEGFSDLVSSSDPNPSLDWDPPAKDMDNAAYGIYNGFVNYYIHQVNLMRHLLCESYEVAYVAPSGVMLAGKSKSGIACVIEMTPYQTTIDWQESALVCFERGWIKIELPAPLASNRCGTVEIFKDPGNGVVPVSVKPEMPWIHAMRQQAINFVGAIQKKNKPLCTSAEALEDLQVARQFLKLYKGV